MRSCQKEFNRKFASITKIMILKVANFNFFGQQNIDLGAPLPYFYDRYQLCDLIFLFQYKLVT
jgi:hypothetical protein